MSGYIGAKIDPEVYEIVKNKAPGTRNQYQRISVYQTKVIQGFPPFFCKVHSDAIPEEYRGNCDTSIEYRASIYMALRGCYGKGSHTYIVMENEDSMLSLDETEAMDKAAEFNEAMASSRIRRYITAYAVTRHYGGPEEGGWWYNAYNPIASVDVPSHLQFPNVSEEYEDELDALMEKVRKEHSEVIEGDISSVLGGTALEVLVEPTKNHYQTLGRPHYE